ncbi:hypothetical protein MED92_10944 [Oceanospirillum sp. MED92]|uniref:Purine-nucleoside phosphorylase n=2 Tax=Neptuniibacter caesariensis TaxID=207954 RepID=A0A7U8C4E4_NEPCE|nr:hypothetical protein MED92_10944 [Oceanospirillum sp. MED92] [Neptuniibacter caesariensis]
MLGDNVRYDGGNHLIKHPIIQRWKQEGRLVTICPEIAGGLPTPRPPAETQCKFPIFITTRDGNDVTPEFLTGAEKALEMARRENVACALMKAKSPSCGNKRIYDGNFTNTLIEGSGVAAAELIRNGIPVFSEKELDDLFAFIEDSEKIPA